MRFKSIQFSVAALAGASVLAVVVALVLYSLFSGARTQAMVEENTHSLLEQMIKSRLVTLAEAQVSQIQRELEYPLVVAGNLAQVNALMGETDANGNALIGTSREELSNMLRNVVLKNPKLIDAYIGWEPNAFDQDDDLYAGQTENAYDDSGRFMPWWYRKADGTPTAEPLGSDMENEKLLPTGVRAGEYYLCPRETKGICIIDPAPYEMGGKMVLMASFNVPILVNGQFRGVVGADLAVDFIQELLKQANSELYDGAGEMALISSNGRLVAYTKDASKLGEPSAQSLNGLGDLKQLQLGEAKLNTDGPAGKSSCCCPSPWPIRPHAGRWSCNCRRAPCTPSY